MKVIRLIGAPFLATLLLAGITAAQDKESDDHR
jgi:hypothetical protein